jgi:gliding motility-associated-like protein
MIKRAQQIFVYVSMQKIKHGIILLIMIMLSGIFTPNQVIAQTEQDCIGAISVCQPVYNQTTSYFGYGDILDYYGDESCSGLCLENEANSVWYTFQVQADGILDFRIDPVDYNSDYDWALFDLTNNSCEDLQTIWNHYDLIVSCNSSYDYGITGANSVTPNTNDDCSPPSSLGEYPINNAAIPVSAGEIYYLNIQNWSGTSGGYTLDFGNSTASIYDINPPTATLTATPDCGGNSFTVHFDENIDCSSVNPGDFNLIGSHSGPYTVTSIYAEDCASGGNVERDFVVSFSPAITTQDNFTVTYTSSGADMCGNVASNEIWNFTINSSLNITLTSGSATENQSICLNDAITDITYSSPLGESANFSGLPAGVNGDFNSSTGNITISGTPTESGTFNYTITVNGDCGTVTETGTISINNNATPTFNNFGPYCQNETPNTLPTVSNNGISGTWSPSSINTSTPGVTNYTFTPIAGACAPPISIDIEVLNEETPQFDQLGPYCQHETPDALPSASTNGISGTWSPSVINTSTVGSTQYTFTPNTGSCVTNTTMSITILENPVVQVIVSQELDCNGNDGVVTVSATGGSQPYSGTGVFPVSSGYHEFTVTDANGCSNDAGIFMNAPDPMIGRITKHQDALCAGENSASIQVTITQGTPSYTAYWQNNSTTSVTNDFLVEELRAGIYTVTVEDANGCTISESVVLNEPIPLLANHEANGPSCIGNDDGFIEITAEGGIPPYSFIFGSLEEANGLFENLEAGDYYYQVKDSNECLTEIAEVFLHDVPEDCLRIPNAFTPNDDGVNDTWEIQNIDMFPYAEVRIYNRWGQKLYFSNNYLNEQWDGKFDNKFVPAGTYLYVIQTYTTAEPVTGVVSVIY